MTRFLFLAVRLVGNSQEKERSAVKCSNYPDHNRHGDDSCVSQQLLIAVVMIHDTVLAQEAQAHTAVAGKHCWEAP